MGLLGGVLKSVVNPMSLAQLAMGPAGWASILMKAAISQIGQQMIQQLGQQLNLPSAVTNMASQAFSGAMGGGQMGLNDALTDHARQLGFNATQTGQLIRDVNNLVSDTARDFVQDNIDQIREAATNWKKDKSEGASGSSGKESFLVAFAKAMGKAMDAKMDKMMDISRKIDKETKASNDSDGKKKAVISEMSAEMQGLSQELGLLGQALSTSVKAAGEAMSTIARKG